MKLSLIKTQEANFIKPQKFACDNCASHEIGNRDYIVLTFTHPRSQGLFLAGGAG